MKKNSKQYQIIEHLLLMEFITPLVAWKEYGVYRLSSCIHRLRSMGFGIRTDQGSLNGNTFAIYILRSRRNARKLLKALNA